MTYKYGTAEKSLNPYSTGICSLSSVFVVLSGGCKGLNPYSTGICSLSYCFSCWESGMSSSLNPYSTGICSLSVIDANGMPQTITES